MISPSLFAWSEFDTDTQLSFLFINQSQSLSHIHTLSFMSFVKPSKSSIVFHNVSVSNHTHISDISSQLSKSKVAILLKFGSVDSVVPL